MPPTHPAGVTPDGRCSPGLSECSHARPGRRTRGTAEGFRIPPIPWLTGKTRRQEIVSRGSRSHDRTAWFGVGKEPLRRPACRTARPISDVPLPLMRLMAVLMRPFKPVLAGHIAAGLVMDTHDMTAETGTRTGPFASIPATTLRDIVREELRAA